MPDECITLGAVYSVLLGLSGMEARARAEQSSKIDTTFALLSLMPLPAATQCFMTGAFFSPSLSSRLVVRFPDVIRSI